MMRNRNSLIVEDSRIIAMHIGRELERVGYRVEVTPDALEALEKIKQKGYELIIFSEPQKLNGGEFYKEVAKFNKDLVKKIIFISSWATDDIVSTGNPFLVKPFLDEELTKTFNEVVA